MSARYYMHNILTKREGVTVVVDDPQKPPNIGAAGMELHPATLTNVAVKKQLAERLPKPYTSNCSSVYPFTGVINT